MTVSRTPVRDALICLVCNKPGPGLDIDHIVNRGMGGSKERDVAENKVPLCRPCHEIKTKGYIKTWISYNEEDCQLTYHWQKRDSDVVIRIPVRVDTRHGCLVPAGGDDERLGRGNRSHLGSDAQRDGSIERTISGTRGNRALDRPPGIVACDEAEPPTVNHAPGQQGS